MTTIRKVRGSTLRDIAAGSESRLPRTADLSGAKISLAGDERTRSNHYASGMRSRSLGSLWAGLDRNPALTDGAIAVLFAALASLWLWLEWPPQRLPATPAVACLGLVQCLPLAWRRRYPLEVLAAVTLGTILFGLAGGADTPWTANAWLLAAYTAGVQAANPWRDRVRIAATAVFVGYVAYEVFFGLPSEESLEPAGKLLLFQLFTLIGNVAFVVWIWWFADTTRLRHEREAQLAEQTRQLEREREENARRAVLDERVRIARELHDVVAHHVSLMGVQAGAARRVFHRQPEKAEEVLGTIEATGREAVQELHRLLGFLRREEEDGLAPQPSMRHLESLVAQMREAGLPVALTVEGEPRPLPPGVDLSAYRIVQEALTNTLKHAGPATAAVNVRYGAKNLEIEVSDDGQTTAVGAAPVAGNGMIGMRERVGLLGGSLQIDRLAGAGFRVRARLPLNGRPA